MASRPRSRDALAIQDGQRPRRCGRGWAEAASTARSPARRPRPRGHPCARRERRRTAGRGRERRARLRRRRTRLSPRRRRHHARHRVPTPAPGAALQEGIHLARAVGGEGRDRGVLRPDLRRRRSMAPTSPPRGQSAAGALDRFLASRPGAGRKGGALSSSLEGRERKSIGTDDGTSGLQPGWPSNVRRPPGRKPAAPRGHGRRVRTRRWGQLERVGQAMQPCPRRQAVPCR